jgi:hypothetical protein
LSYAVQVGAKAEKLQAKLERQSTKAVKRLQKQEARIKAKMARTDSLKAAEIFGHAEQSYEELQKRIANASGRQYIPSLDTLSVSLRFLEQNSSAINGERDKIKQALAKVNGLEGQFQRAEEIKKFLKERRQYLKERLSQLGFAKQLKRLNKQAYYYSEQLNEYKALLKDHKKAERKAVELLSKTKLFKDFFRKNSMLASLFRMPGDPNDPATQANLAGLQTRAQVNNLIQQQVGNAPAAQAQFRQNIQEAQSRMNKLKEEILRKGSGSGSSSDAEMPEGFKPNNQKTKSFLKRLEYGTNIQTQKATNFFPVTSDIGLSVGYKLNDKSIIGIGGSYKMGMGRGWNHLRLSNEGIGIRSFIDWKIKGSFWISGGYEQNYKTAFSDFSQLNDYSAWQQSGLIGLSKVVSLKTKFFKKTKLQLLWDFLSYEQVPKTQPVVFRIGYNF